MADLQQKVAAQVIETAIKTLETQVDEELGSLADEDIAQIHKKRLADLKKRQKDQETFSKAGHGSYEEITHEQEFFHACNGSERVIIHFYRPSVFRCAILDKHFKILAPKHMETKFIKLNVEKSPFLVERLRTKVIPTILVSVNAQIVDRIVGFTSLGNTDEFSTRMLEWRLAQSDGIYYSGDKLTPPDEPTGAPKRQNILKKTIRGVENDDESEDEDEGREYEGAPKKETEEEKSSKNENFDAMWEEFSKELEEIDEKK